MKKFLSLVLALVMTMSLVTISAGAKDFTDGSKVKYTEAVDVMSAVKVIDGYTDGSFRPTTELNRGAAAKIICNMILGPTTASALNATSAPFKDVPADSVFAGYITYCAKEGIINGYSDGTFRPTAPLTGYAFMKMLLGALGYDAAQEGFTGANWGVNVAKQAIGIDLDDGNDDFNGSKYVTREEACLYAFNTLQATMVEYGSKTTVNVNGATVVVGGSEADEVSGRGYKSYKPLASGEDNETLEFCEKYFSDLKLKDDDTDDFARPANIWRVKNEKVGTYSKTPDAVYTAEVESGDIYSDLGLTDSDTYDVYRNGLVVDLDDATTGDQGFLVKRGNEDKLGGNGVLVEVYKDDAVITMIDTYVGEVVTFDEATSKKDAYITIDGKDGSNYPADMATGDNNEFETEAFEEEDVVLFTYSEKVDEVKSVVAAESVSGEVSAYKANKNFTMGDTTYEYSAQINTTVSRSDIESEITAYLDAYGYVISFEEGDVNTANYALVLKAGVDSNRGGKDKWAELLYTDGTTETVKTKKIYGTDGTLSVAADTDLKGHFVTFKTNSKDEVTLTAGTGTSKKLGAGSVQIENGKAKASLGGTKNVSVSSATIFLVYDKTNDEYTVYTGIKNVPDVDDNGSAISSTNYAYYKKNGSNTAFLVYVEAEASEISASSQKTIFIAGDDGAKLQENSDDMWYSFKGVVDGQVIDITLDASDATTLAVIADLLNNENKLMTQYSEDEGFYTVSNANIVSGDDGDVCTGGAVVKADDGVVTLGGTELTLAEKVDVFKADDGKVSTSRLSAVRTGDIGVGEYYEYVAYTLNDDGEVNSIYFELN